MREIFINKFTWEPYCHIIYNICVTALNNSIDFPLLIIIWTAFDRRLCYYCYGGSICTLIDVRADVLNVLA